jgi:hypothetical protein
MSNPPQNILKISSDDPNGTYLRMVFDAEGMTHAQITEKFNDFLLAMGNEVEVKSDEVLPPFPKPGAIIPVDSPYWNPAG